MPSSFVSGSTINVPVVYAANQTRDIVVELWQNGNYLGQERHVVSAGSGTENVPLSLTPTPVGSNFLIKANLRPTDAQWEQNINGCNKLNVVIQPEPVEPPVEPPVDPSAEYASCSSMPTTLQSASTISIPVEYAASEPRDVVVELWQNGAYLTQNRVTVAAGSGTANVPVTLSPAPSGSNFLIKGDIRPIGTPWQQSIDGCGQSNVVIQSSGGGSGGSCDIQWSSPNKSITQRTLNFVSEPIDISCAASATISMDIEGLTPQVMENADYLNIAYAIDGGSRITLSENRDGFAQKRVSSTVQGSSLVLYINGYTSWNDETYNIRNISVDY